MSFFISQSRTAEPIIPPRLFRSRIFTTATLIGLLVIGVGMFAFVGFLPTYLQMVYGVSATESGLLLIPMVAGIMATAIPSGQLMSKTGRYKIYPILGTAFVGVAAVLMSAMDTETSLVLVCSYVFLLGAGVGLAMRPLVLAVQNDCSLSCFRRRSSPTTTGPARTPRPFRRWRPNRMKPERQGWLVDGVSAPLAG